MRASFPKGRAIVLAAGFILFLASAGLAAEEKIVRLKDGVVLRGALVAQDSGTYQIKHGTLGVLSVKKSEIASIEDPAPAHEAVVSSAAGAAELKAYEQKILGSPGIMESVRALAEDKSVAEMLSDPELSAAILRRDVEYLQRSKKFLEFTANPQVQKIVRDAIDPEHGAAQDGESARRTGAVGKAVVLR